MRRRTKAALISIFVLVLLAIAIGSGVADYVRRQVATGPLRAQLESELSEAFDLAVTIETLDGALLPSPHLDARHIEISDPSAETSTPILSIDQLAVGVELGPLFRNVVRIDALEITGADLHLSANRKDSLPGELDLESLVEEDSEDELDLQIRTVRVEALRIFQPGPIDTQDEDTAPRSLLLESFQIESRHLGSDLEFETKGQFEGGKIVLSGQIGSLSELIRPSRPFPVDIEGQLFEARVEATGTVRNPWTFEGLDLAVSASIPKLVVGEHALPELGEIQLEGRLSNRDGPLGLEKIRLDTTRPKPIALDARGEIRDLLAGTGVDLDLRIDAESLDFLTPILQSLTDYPLPEHVALSADLEIFDAKQDLTLTGDVRASLPEETVSFGASGSIAQLRDVPKIDAQIELTARDTASLNRLVPDLPIQGPFGPINATGRLRSRENELVLSQIVLRGGDPEKAWLEIDGSVEDLVAFRDVDLQLRIGSESLHHLREIVARELPETSPFVASAALHDGDGSLGLEQIRIRGGEESPVEIDLEAKLDDLRNLDEIDIDLSIRAEHLQMLGALFGVDLPPVGPVDVRGALQHTVDRTNVENLRIELGESRFDGGASGTFAEETRPTMKVRLASKRVRLQDIGLIPKQGSRKRPSDVPPTEALDWSRYDDVAIPFDVLRQINLDAGLQFDRVTGYQGFDAQNMNIQMHLEDGYLVVSDAGARYEEGRLRSRIKLDARATEPEVTFEVQSQGFNMARVMIQFDEETEYSGVLDVDFALHARGETVGELRRSLGGRTSLSLRDGNLASKMAREFVFSLVSVAFRGLRSEDAPSIGCAVADLQIENGIGSVQTLFLKGRKVQVSGAGEVDLVNAKYDLHLAPKASNPGVLSVAPEVRVTGPLDAPDFQAVRRTFFTSFGHGVFKSAVNAGTTLTSPFRSRFDRTQDALAHCRAEAAKAQAAVQDSFDPAEPGASPSQGR